MAHDFDTLHMITLDVPQYDTSLEAVCTIDFTTGEVRYDVNGARAEGVFRISPTYDTDTVDPDTPRVKISFGDQAPDEPRYFGWRGYFARPNRPIINGSVKLVGWAKINLDRIDDRPTPYSLGVQVHRQIGNCEEDSAYAPDRTNERVTAIMVALVGHWRNLPGNAEIRLAAARHALKDGEHLDRKREQIERLHAEITERRTALIRHQDDHNAMCRLLNTPAELIGVPVLAR